ncbi:hypothetical protein ACN24M_00620 [Streptomyces microflavus]
MADLLHTDPSLTPDQAAGALGYPAGQVRRATVRAQAVLRARRAAPYLADVAQALHRQGWTTTAAAPTVHHPADDVVTATLTLDGPTRRPRTRLGRAAGMAHRHFPPAPLTKGGALPPEGDGIRYSPPAPHPRRTP